jgi:hypothetical protein
MTSRRKRCLLGCGILLLALAATLALLEWGRRREVAAAGAAALDGSGTVVSADDLEEQYRDPEAFARLCGKVTERVTAMQQRFLRLQHTRKTRQTSYDTKGQTLAIREVVYQVRFHDGKEHKQLLEQRQLLGKPPLFDLNRLLVEQTDMALSLPFSATSAEGLYRYRREGVEELQGCRLLRLHFEPARAIERSFAGSAWVDPVTHALVRLQGSPVKTRIAVDHFDMILDYGPSENGHHQLRHVVMDMAGGFALFSGHYRIESELSAYREIEK